MRVFYIILTRCSFDAFWCDALALSFEERDRLTTDAELTKKKKILLLTLTQRRTSFVVLANPNKSLTHSST